MKSIYVVLISAILWLLNSCSNKQETELISIEKVHIPSDFIEHQIFDSLSVFLPSQLRLTNVGSDYHAKDLVDIQYVDIMAVECDSLTSLERYTESIIKQDSVRLKSFKLVSIEDFKTEYAVGKCVKIEGQPYGWPLKNTYWYSIVKSNNHFINIKFWTISSQASNSENDALIITKSFK